MRLPSRPLRRDLTGGVDAEDVRAPRRELAGVRTAAHRRRGSRGQQRGGRGRRSPATATRSASSRTTPRSPSCSSCSAGSGRRGASGSSRGATSAGDVRRAPPQRDPRAPDRLGLPERRDPGPPVRGVDDAAGGTRRRSPRGAGATIGFLAVRRRPDGRYGIEVPARFTVPSSSPADLQRATQRIADALEATVRAAPEQWYSFKPLWPPDEAEAAALEQRAREMLGGDTGRDARTVGAFARARRPRRLRSGGLGVVTAAAAQGRRRAPASVARSSRAGRRSSRGCPRARSSRPPSPSESSGTGPRPGAGRRRGRTWRASARVSRRPAAGPPGPASRRPIPRPSSASSGPRSATRRGTTWRSRGRTPTTSSRPSTACTSRRPRSCKQALAGRPPGDHHRPPLRRDRAPGRPPVARRGAAGDGADGDRRGPGAPGLVRALARARRRRHRPHRELAPVAHGRAPSRRVGRPGGGPGPHRGWRRGPLLRPSGPDPGRARPAVARDRRADRRRRRPPDARGRRVPRPPDPAARARDRHAPGAHDRPHRRDRGRVRDHPRGCPRAVVGRLPPDLAGPRAAGRRHRGRHRGTAGTAEAGR